MRGLRNCSRAFFVAILTFGAIVAVASPASAAIGLTFTTSGLPEGVAVAGTVTTTNNGCNNPSAKAWNLTTPNVSNSNSTGNGAGCPSAPYTQPATLNSAAGDRYTFQSGSPASPISATGSSAIQVTLTYALTCTHISITSQPASVTKTLGESATFSVTATGTSPQYQWRKGTTNISGATSSSYTIPSVVAADAASNYNVVVSNSCGATVPSVTSANATLTFTKVTSTITWSDPAAVDYGTALSATQLNATASVPGSFVYTPAAGAVPGAGSQSLHAAFTPTDTATYTNATADVTLVVNPVPLVATANDAARAYGAADPALTATYGGFVNGETASVVTTPATCTTTATTASPPGTYPITCASAVSANYTISYVAGTLTVTNGALVVTGNNASRNYGDANPALIATVSGFGNGEDENVLTSTPSCTTTADESSPAGTYPIICSGAAADNYDITYVDGTLTVLPAPLSVSVADASRDYGAANPVFAPIVTGFVNGENESDVTTLPVCASSATAISNAGTYSITCSGGTADNYSFSYTAGTLTVDPIGLTATANDANREYGAADSLSATITGFVNGDDEGDLTTLPSCATTADESSAVGDYPISCSGAAADNYTFSYVDGTLTITPANLTVTGDDASRAYSSANPALTATITGFVNDEDDNVLTTNPTCTTTADESSPVGEYPITCSGAAADNYTFSYVAGTLTVDPVNLTVTADEASRAYGAANPAFGSTVTGFVNDEDDSVLTAAPSCSTTTDESSAVGDYPISCSGAAADNYTFSYVDGTLTITPANLTVTGNDASRAYGAANPAFGSTVTGFVNDEDDSVLTAAPSCSTTADESSPVGEYPITCSGAAADNYTFSYVDGTLTVGPLTLTVTADDVARGYGADNPALTASITGFVNGDDAGDLTTLPTCSTTAVATTPVGTAAITCTDAADDDYSFTYADGTLTITPANLTVTGNDATRAYGAANPALTATITGFVNDEDDSVLTTNPTCTTTADELSPVGDSPITCSGAAADNYTFSYSDGTLTVDPGALAVTAQDATRAYGAANPTFTAVVTGFVNGEDDGVLTSMPICSSAATESSPTGNAPITCSGAAADNYTFSYVDGTLTITPVALTVTAGDASRTYGADNPVFTTTVTGFVNGEDESVLTGTPLCFSAASSTPVGIYAISCAAATADNYTFDYVDGTLTITSAPLTVTANNASRPAGSPNAAFTASVTGFVNDETTSVLTAQPACTSTADESSPVGEYPITCSGAAADNYSFAYVDGTLTVTPAGPVIRVGDASVAEGSTTLKKNSLTFTVTVDKPVTAPTEVLWALSDGTATGGKASPADFQAKTNGKLKLAIGKKSGVVNVNVLPDTTIEVDETLTLTLLSANSSAVLGDATATGTILDDDTGAGMQMSIGDVQVWEGNTGAQAAVGKLWVTLNNPAVSTVTVTVAVSGGTATDGKVSPADYKTFKTKTLTFNAGQWKKPVSLSVLADSGVEPDETVIVTLSAASPGVTITKGTGTLTILNDD